MSLASDEEQKYLDNLFKHLSDDNTRNAYIEPVINKLVKMSAKGTVPYEKAEKMIKRGVNELADDWKLRHVMVLPVSKAGKERQVMNLVRSIMEIYFIRSREAKARS